MKIPPAVALGLLGLVAAPAPAQPPLLTNGQVQTRTVSGTLEATFTSAASAIDDAGWIGYETPLVTGDHFMCDWNDQSRSRAPTTRATRSIAIRTAPGGGWVLGTPGR